MSASVTVTTVIRWVPVTMPREHARRDPDGAVTNPPCGWVLRQLGGKTQYSGERCCEALRGQTSELGPATLALQSHAIRP